MPSKHTAAAPAVQRVMTEAIERGATVFDDLPEALRERASRHDFAAALREQCIVRCVPYRQCPASVQERTPEAVYVQDVLKLYQRDGRVFPYDMAVEVARHTHETPLTYYQAMLNAMLSNSRSYDTLPNFTALDVLRLFNVGRNQYLELTKRVRARTIMWRVNRSYIMDELPQRFVDATAPGASPADHAGSTPLHADSVLIALPLPLDKAKVRISCEIKHRRDVERRAMKPVPVRGAEPPEPEPALSSSLRQDTEDDAATVVAEATEGQPRLSSKAVLEVYKALLRHTMGAVTMSPGAAPVYAADRTTASGPLGLTMHDASPPSPIVQPGPSRAGPTPEPTPLLACTVPKAELEVLWHAGLVVPAFVVLPRERLTVPPFDRFVMNRTAEGWQETFLYNVVGTIDEERPLLDQLALVYDGATGTEQQRAVAESRLLWAARVLLHLGVARRSGGRCVPSIAMALLDPETATLHTDGSSSCSDSPLHSPIRIPGAPGSGTPARIPTPLLEEASPLPTMTPDDLIVEPSAETVEVPLPTAPGNTSASPARSSSATSAADSTATNDGDVVPVDSPVRASDPLPPVSPPSGPSDADKSTHTMHSTMHSTLQSAVYVDEADCIGLTAHRSWRGEVATLLRTRGATAAAATPDAVSESGESCVSARGRPSEGEGASEPSNRVAVLFDAVLTGYLMMLAQGGHKELKRLAVTLFEGGRLQHAMVLQLCQLAAAALAEEDPMAAALAAAEAAMQAATPAPSAAPSTRGTTARYQPPVHQATEAPLPQPFDHWGGAKREASPHGDEVGQYRDLVAGLLALIEALQGVARGGRAVEVDLLKTESLNALESEAARCALLRQRYFAAIYVTPGVVPAVDVAQLPIPLYGPTPRLAFTPWLLLFLAHKLRRGAPCALLRPGTVLEAMPAFLAFPGRSDNAARASAGLEPLGVPADLPFPQSPAVSPALSPASGRLLGWDEVVSSRVPGRHDGLRIDTVGRAGGSSFNVYRHSALPLLQAQLGKDMLWVRATSSFAASAAVVAVALRASEAEVRATFTAVAEELCPGSGDRLRAGVAAASGHVDPTEGVGFASPVRKNEGEESDAPEVPTTPAPQASKEEAVNAEASNGSEEGRDAVPSDGLLQWLDDSCRYHAAVVAALHAEDALGLLHYEVTTVPTPPPLPKPRRPAPAQQSSTTVPSPPLAATLVNVVFGVPLDPVGRRTVLGAGPAAMATLRTLLGDAATAARNEAGMAALEAELRAFIAVFGADCGRPGKGCEKAFLLPCSQQLFVPAPAGSSVGYDAGCQRLVTFA